MSSAQVMYLIGAPPALAFPLYYHFTARWWESREGRLFMMITSLPFFLYLSPLVFLFLPPDDFRDTVRLVLGVIAAATTWTTLIMYYIIRREGVRDTRRSIRESAEKGE